MRKLATIRRIDRLSMIEGADKIELAHTGGWQCVVGKGQFHPGELAIFYEIDSALPIDDPRYVFLHDRCKRTWKNNSGETLCEVVRIKSCKFRGQISQGLFMPIREFPEIEIRAIEDADFTEELNILHYDEVCEKMNLITGKAKLCGEQKGNFPSFIPKTDEERLQNLTDYFNSMKEVAFECTEKFDGSSMTVFYAPERRPDSPFGVCSRNFELKLENPGNAFVEMANSLEVEEKLKQAGFDIAVQGELVGPGLNGNRDQYASPEFRVFRIFNVGIQKWLSASDRRSLCEKLDLQHVKLLRDNWKVFSEFHSMDDFLQFVKGKTDHGHEREGMVWKSENGEVSFKVINNDYLLKQKD